MAHSTAVTPESDEPTGPYVERSRADWADLAASTEMTLDAGTLDTLRGLRDPTGFDDVREVYLPLTALLNQYVDLTGQLRRSTNDSPGKGGCPHSAS